MVIFVVLAAVLLRVITSVRGRGARMNCKVCGEEIDERRAALGYTTCLEHGEDRKEFTVAPAYNKGGYQLITRSCVKDIGRK